MPLEANRGCQPFESSPGDRRVFMTLCGLFRPASRCHVRAGGHLVQQDLHVIFAQAGIHDGLAGWYHPPYIRDRHPHVRGDDVATMVLQTGRRYRQRETGMRASLMTSDRYWVFFSVLLMGMMLCVGGKDAWPAVHSSEVDPRIEKALRTEKRVVVMAQGLIDSGEYEEANRLLEQAILKFPGRDILLALRGESLFLSQQVDASEGFFMQALSLNQQNEVAKKYIAEIRNVRELSTSEDLQEWLAIGKDKFADFLVLVISIWLGTTINSIGGAVAQWRFHRQSRKDFQSGNYEDLTDHLEKKIRDYEPDAVRDILRFMLKERDGNEAEVKKILEDYVEYNEHLETLLRILHRCAQSRSPRAT